MTVSELSRELGAAIVEKMGTWVAVGLFCVVAVLAFMNPPSRGIGILYGILAVGAVVYSAVRTRTEIRKKRL